MVNNRKRHGGGDTDMISEIEYAIVHEVPYRKIALHEQWITMNLAMRLPKLESSLIGIVVRETCKLVEELSGIGNEELDRSKP